MTVLVSTSSQVPNSIVVTVDPFAGPRVQDTLTLDEAVALQEKLYEVIEQVSADRKKQIQQELTRLQMEMERLSRLKKAETAEKAIKTVDADPDAPRTLKITPRRDTDEGEMVL